MIKKSKKDSLLAAKIRGREKGCSFCKTKTIPRWEDYEGLKEYLSPRGRIIGAQYSGVCVKHQRKLSDVIKQARHLGLVPFTTQN
ncbi:MAG: 30S ribosomal protein S18 [Candidatus Shapirobacteria bacterium]|jgi:small subunit ribosomal protein S18